MSVPDPSAVDWVPIWPTGIAIPPIQPSTRVARSAALSVASGTWTVVSFDTVRFDSGAQWASGQPTRLTCQITGTYAISGIFGFVGQAGGGHRLSAIKLNGGRDLGYGGMAGSTIIAGPYPYSPAIAVMQLYAGDYVELWVYQDSGASLAMNPSTAGNWAGAELSMALLGGMQGPPGGLPTYGTSLPANPTDGQEAILVDNITNPSYQWRFRYNAASASSYKWEYIGGAPMVAEWRGGATAGNGSQKVGTGLIAPRAGLYDVDYGIVGQIGTANAADVYCELRVAGSAVGGDWQDLMAIVRSIYDKFALTKAHRVTANAGGAIDVYAGTTSAPTVTITAQHIRMTPMRIS